MGVSTPVIDLNDTLTNSTCPIYPWAQAFIRLWLGVPVALFGLLANGVNVRVFASCKMRTARINWGLLALALADIGLLLTTLLFLSCPVLADELSSQWLIDVSVYFVAWIYPLGVTFRAITIYLTVVISLQRFFAVCHPFLMHRIESDTNVLAALALTVALCALYCLPAWFEVSTSTCFNHNTQTWTLLAIPTSLRRAPGYVLGYRTFAYSFVLFLAPFLLLLAANIAIICTLRRASTSPTRNSTRSADSAAEAIQRKRSRWDYLQTELPNDLHREEVRRTLERRARERRERSTSVMLLGMVAGFMLCNTLALINNFVDLVFIIDAIAEGNPPDGWWPDWFTNTVEIGNLLVMVNPAVSLFVYYSFSSRFRSVFNRLFHYPVLRRVRRRLLLRSYRNRRRYSAICGRRQGRQCTVRHERRSSRAVALTTPNSCFDNDDRQKTSLMHKRSLSVDVDAGQRRRRDCEPITPAVERWFLQAQGRSVTMRGGSDDGSSAECIPSLFMNGSAVAVVEKEEQENSVLESISLFVHPSLVATLKVETIVAHI